MFCAIFNFQTRSRVFREVTKVGAALEKLQEVNGSQNPAEAAVIYDVENRWAVEDAAVENVDKTFVYANPNKRHI